MEVIDVLTQLWKSFHSVDGYEITLYTLIYYNFTSQLHLGKAEGGKGGMKCWYMIQIHYPEWNQPDTKGRML